MSADVVRCAVCDNQMFAATPACVVCGTPNPYAQLAAGQPGEDPPLVSPQQAANTGVAAPVPAQDADSTPFTFDFPAFTLEAPYQSSPTTPQAEPFGLDLSALFTWDDTPAAPASEPEEIERPAPAEDFAYFTSQEVAAPVEAGPNHAAGDVQPPLELRAGDISHEGVVAGGIEEEVPSSITEAAEAAPLEAANSQVYASPLYIEAVPPAGSQEEEVYSPAPASAIREVVPVVPVEEEQQEQQEPGAMPEDEQPGSEATVQALQPAVTTQEEPEVEASPTPLAASLEPAALDEYAGDDAESPSPEVWDDLQPFSTQARQTNASDNAGFEAPSEQKPVAEAAVHSPANDIAPASATAEEPPPTSTLTVEAEDTPPLPSEDGPQAVEEAPLPEVFAVAPVGSSVKMPAIMPAVVLEDEAIESRIGEQEAYSGPPTTPLVDSAPTVEAESLVEEPEQISFAEPPAAEFAPNIDAPQAEEAVISAQPALPSLPGVEYSVPGEAQAMLLAPAVEQESRPAVEALAEPSPALIQPYAAYSPDTEDYAQESDIELPPPVVEPESQTASALISQAELPEFAGLIAAEPQEAAVSNGMRGYEAGEAEEPQDAHSPEIEVQTLSPELVGESPIEAVYNPEAEAPVIMPYPLQEPAPTEEIAVEIAVEPPAWQVQTYGTSTADAARNAEPAASLFDSYIWSPGADTVPPATPEAETLPVAEAASPFAFDITQLQIAEPKQLPLGEGPAMPAPAQPVEQVAPPIAQPEPTEELEPPLIEPERAPFYVQTVTSPLHAEAGATQAGQDNLQDMHAWKPGDDLPDQANTPLPPQEQAVPNGTIYYSQAVQPMSAQQGQAAPAFQGTVQPSALGPASTWDPSRPRPNPGTPEYDELARQAFASRGGNPQAPQVQPWQSQQSQQSPPFQQPQPQPAYNSYQQPAGNQTGPPSSLPKPQPGTPEYEEMARQAFAYRSTHPGAASPQTGPLPQQPQAQQTQQPVTPGPDPNAPKPKPGTPEYEALVRQALAQKFNKQS